jgi:hypothetical protein
VEQQDSNSGLPAISTPTIDTRSVFDSAPHIAQSLGLPLPPLSGPERCGEQRRQPRCHGCGRQRHRQHQPRDPISTINGLLGTVTSADPTGLLSGVIQDLTGTPVSTVTGIVGNPTGAVSSLLRNPTDAVSGVLNTVSQADPRGLVGNVVNTVTSALGSSAGSASAQITAGSSQANARANTNVPAPPPVSLPALPELPAVGDLTST